MEVEVEVEHHLNEDLVNVMDQDEEEQAKTFSPVTLPKQAETYQSPERFN